MNVIRLERHEYPARPQLDLRGDSVLDPSGRYLGEVANLYVDEDDQAAALCGRPHGGLPGPGKKAPLSPDRSADHV
jgi:PRC-barrel domain